MVLYTKSNCIKCDYIKDRFDLAALGVEVKNIDDPTPGLLAELAWNEVVQLASESLPILIVTPGQPIHGSIAVKKMLNWVKNYKEDKDG